MNVQNVPATANVNLLLLDMIRRSLPVTAQSSARCALLATVEADALTKAGGTSRELANLAGVSEPVMLVSLEQLRRIHAVRRVQHVAEDGRSLPAVFTATHDEFAFDVDDETLAIKWEGSS